MVNASDSGSRGRGVRAPLWSNRVVYLSKAHLLPKSTGNTQEAVAPSQHDRKIVYRDVKNQSTNQPTSLRIMKFGTKVGYNKLSATYCYQSLYLFIFLPLQQNFLSQISQLLLKIFFRFCIHLEGGQVYCVKENQDANVYFAFLFKFSFFSIFHSYVMHMDIFGQRYLRNNLM